MDFNRKVKRSLTAIILAVCIIFGQVNQAFADVKDEIRDEVLFYLLQYYKDGVPVEILKAETVDEMMELIDDKYTKYFSKDEYDEFINAIDNKIFGIGVYIKEHEEGLLVSDVIKTGPAEAVGIKSGDIIVKAGDANLKGLTVDEAVTYVKGEKGTEIKITVRRGKEELIFNVVRDEIRLPTVEMEWLNDDTTAHIIINTFGQKTTQEFHDLVKDAQKQEAQNYIIDLRYNGGGYMDVALEIAGMMIGNETVLVVDKKQEKGVELKDYASDIIIDKPIIFLVNNMSASSSEILSAAIRDYDKAYFIGDTTYGKGVAQSLIELSDGSALKVTTQEFFSPGKRKINEIGITPNLKTTDVNPLVLAKLIFGDINDVEEAFAKVQEAEELYVVDDSQYRDKVLNGWEVNVDMISSKLRIKPEQNIKIKFNSELEGDISEIKDDIHIYNGFNGDEIEAEVSVNGKMLIVDPKEELIDGMNYVMSFEPGIKSVDGNKLNRGKMITIKVKK
ncbi:S41 family peptidase [Oceanirhabdus seepicola]|uniref:PDZ domain-containing protein n=1 Tax=Oceanirhabdus seepicola TaxID=2828781 RepID=A0A9J6P0P1_9CLOT|nr:S41 family peptidase [Oceanirhabdus seepicola]MCM1990282.1 PDZ domain-containing protein [Oceanirhabdus seepicola]